MSGTGLGYAARPRVTDLGYEATSYAMSSTGKGYGSYDDMVLSKAMRLPGRANTLGAVPRHPLSLLLAGIFLCAAYAVPGTDIAHPTTCLCACYA
eukprot:3438844-Rhodomonas_salina.6